MPDKRKYWFEVLFFIFPSLFCVTRKKAATDIQKLTESNMAYLVNTWQLLFDEEIVRQNIIKLVEHVQQFYLEILEETNTRQKTIQMKVASKLI